MKQIFLLLAFFTMVALVDVNAQCSKSAAARTASLTSNIVEKQDPSTGEVTYLKKKVCEASGAVSYTAVEFCSKTGQFVNAASTTKASCSKSYSKNAMMVSNELPAQCMTAQKACCLPANQKTQAAKTAFASMENKVIKP